MVAHVSWGRLGFDSPHAIALRSEQEVDEERNKLDHNAKTTRLVVMFAN